MLGIIFPKLEGQLMLAKNVQLTEALQEIKAHEEDTAFLSPQCQFILGVCDQVFSSQNDINSVSCREL